MYIICAYILFNEELQSFTAEVSEIILPSAGGILKKTKKNSVDICGGDYLNLYYLSKKLLF
jgi:hypothetical protein